VEALTGRTDRIYLTGFMGSGKSTIGPILANTIGYDFIDVDLMIEESEGMSVSEIFRTRGEEYFRVLERKLVMQISTSRKTVISLGGGAMIDPESYGHIRNTGIVIYLKLTPEQLFKRLRNKIDRPMLTDPQGGKLGEAGLRARILQLYNQREPVYAAADIVIPTDESKVGLTVDRLAKKLLPLLR
jgi:shikimate kinase